MHDRVPAKKMVASMSLCLFNYLPLEILLPIFKQLEVHHLKKIFVSSAVSKEIDIQVWQGLTTAMTEKNVQVFFQSFKFLKRDIENKITFETQFFQYFNKRLLGFVSLYREAVKPDEYYLKIPDGKKVWPNNLKELRNI